jgi:hypothetical protein
MSPHLPRRVGVAMPLDKVLAVRGELARAHELLNDVDLWLWGGQCVRMVTPFLFPFLVQDSLASRGKGAVQPQADRYHETQ